MLKENLLYKSTVLIVHDLFFNYDKIINSITLNTKFRIIKSTSIEEAHKKSKRNRVDLIILSSNLYFDKAKQKENLSELKKLKMLHPGSIFLVLFKSKFRKNTNLDKYIKVTPNFIPINEPIANEKLFLLNLSNASFYSRIISDNRGYSLKLKNLITQNKKMLHRLEEFVEKENERAVTFNNMSSKIKTNINSIPNEVLKQVNDTEITNKDSSNNDNILDKLTNLFKKLNKLNRINSISSELENKIPTILNINKFSIFLIGKEFRDLKHFASSNFNGKKNNVLTIDQIFEKSVMFDTIFKREVIYLKNYKNSKFSVITETDNEYLKYSNTDSLCIPLMSGNKIIGVGNFNDSKLGFFSKDQLNHISMFANYLAILLDNILPTIDVDKEKESVD